MSMSTVYRRDATGGPWDIILIYIPRPHHAPVLPGHKPIIDLSPASSLARHPDVRTRSCVRPSGRLKA
jgi:hypothetical protein